MITLAVTEVSSPSLLGPVLVVERRWLDEKIQPPETNETNARTMGDDNIPKAQRLLQLSTGQVEVDTGIYVLMPLIS